MDILGLQVPFFLGIFAAVLLIPSFFAAVEKTETDQIVVAWSSLETRDHTHITGSQDCSVLAEVHDIAIRILAQPEILPSWNTSRS